MSEIRIRGRVGKERRSEGLVVGIWKERERRDFWIAFFVDGLKYIGDSYEGKIGVG